MNQRYVTLIEPNKSFFINFREFLNYKDLMYSLILRDIKIVYKQSVLGVGWAIIKPLITVLIYTLIFGRIANLRTDGITDDLFFFSGLVSWLYFTTALASSSSSLNSNSNILTKVYFPRLILPLTPVVSKLMDFFIALILFIVMMLWKGFYPDTNIIYFPLILLMLIMTISGSGLLLSSLSVQYRDISHASGYFIQLLLFISPVFVSVSYIPQEYRNLYAFNPLVGIVEGFRAALLGVNPMPWDLILPGMFTTLVLFITGILVFNRLEKHFADII